MHSVRGVDIRHKHKTLNEIAQWITQSGSPNRRPIWDKSIRGQGELIACADTGLDFDHCMFRDTDIPRYEFGVSHRKINNYIVCFWFWFCFFHLALYCLLTWYHLLAFYFGVLPWFYCMRAFFTLLLRYSTSFTYPYTSCMCRFHPCYCPQH